MNDFKPRGFRQHFRQDTPWTSRSIPFYTHQSGWRLNDYANKCFDHTSLGSF